MPAVIGAIAAAAPVAAGFSTFLGFSGITGALLAGVSSFALSALQGALTPKPKAPSFDSFAVASTNRTLQIQQPITADRIIYGEVRVSGPLVFAASTSDEQYLHLVIALARHEVEAIDEIWVGDQIVPNDYIDSNGNVIAGRYSGKLRIKKYLGLDGQTADPDLIAEVTEWTSEHRGRGVAYIYARLQKDRDVYPTGAPNFSAVVRGKKLYDPRTGLTTWSPNPALQEYDYLTWKKYGPGAVSVDVDMDTVTAAANSSEEIVTTENLDCGVSSIDTATDIITLEGDILKLQRGDRVEVVTTGSAPGGLATSTNYYAIPYQFAGTPRIKLASSLDNAIAGTATNITGAGSGTHTIRKTGEPRYFGGGVVETDKAVGDNMRDILSGMGGTIVNVGGLWSMFAAVYRSPSVTFDEGHLRAPITVQTRVSRQERFNTVKGIYVSPMNDWQPADYPVVASSTYVSNDNNETMIRDLDLPFTQRAHAAQRLAKIYLERARREISLDYPSKLHAIQFQPTDTLSINNTRMAWTSKVFEVHTHQLVEDRRGDAPAIGVDMFLRETDSAAYSWSSSEEGEVAPAARTNFPDPFVVSPPVGLSINSILVETQAADNIFRVVLSWQLYTNQFVLQGGYFQIQYKRSADTDWIPTGINPDGTDTTADVFTGSLGNNYDIRIRAVNSLLATSGWSPLTGFVVGTAGGIGATEDWGNWTEALGPTEDWGNWTDSVGATEDWGGFTA